MGEAHLLDRNHQVERKKPPAILLVVFAKRHYAGRDVTDEVVEKVSGVDSKLSVRRVHPFSRTTLRVRGGTVFAPSLTPVLCFSASKIGD